MIQPLEFKISAVDSSIRGGWASKEVLKRI